SLGTSAITLNWSNTGIAPVYEKWDTYLEIRSGTKVIWSQKSAFNPRYFLPGTQSITDQLPAGQGDLYLIIRDPAGYKKPLPLSITGRQADGSYLIKAGVNIGGTTTPPDTIPTPPVDTVPVIVPPVVIHDTIRITVHDTIPRTCPACPVCPPIPKQRSVKSIIYDDGSSTNL